MGADLDLFTMKGTPWICSWNMRLSVFHGFFPSPLVCATRVMAGSDRFPLRRLWASESKVQQVRPTRRQTSKSGLDTLGDRSIENLAYWPADLSRHGGKVVRQILGCRPQEIWIQFSIESGRLSLCISLKPLLVVMQETAWTQAN